MKFDEKLLRYTNEYQMLNYFLYGYGLIPQNLADVSTFTLKKVETVISKLL